MTEGLGSFRKGKMKCKGRRGRIGRKRRRKHDSSLMHTQTHTLAVASSHVGYRTGVLDTDCSFVGYRTGVPDTGCSFISHWLQGKCSSCTFDLKGSNQAEPTHSECSGVDEMDLPTNCEYPHCGN